MVAVGVYLRQGRFGVERKACLGPHEVDEREELVGAEDVVDVGPDVVGHGRQDADYFAALGIGELAQLVVDGHHLGRLNEAGAPRGRLVEHYAADLALVGRRHGDDGPPLANRHGGVGLHYALGLRLPQDGRKPLRHGALLGQNVAADGGQVGRGAVADVAVLVEDALDALGQHREHGHRLGAPGQGGVLVGLRPEEAHHLAHRPHGTRQSAQLGLLKIEPLDADAPQGLAQVVEALARERLVRLQYAAELVGQRQGGAHLVGPRAKGHRLGHLGARPAQAVPGHKAAHGGEFYLLFKIVRIYHSVMSLFF